MAQLPQCSGQQAVRAFERLGYRKIRQQGSHVFMKVEGRTSLSIPQHKVLAKGTLHSLIRNAGITVEEFTALL